MLTALLFLAILTTYLFARNATLHALAREDGRELALLEAERETLQRLLIDCEERVADIKARAEFGAAFRDVPVEHETPCNESDNGWHWAQQNPDGSWTQCSHIAEAEAVVEEFRAEIEAFDGGAL